VVHPIPVSSGRRACIVGVGETPYTRRGQARESEYRLALRAILAAVTDAGLAPEAIDGLTTFADERSGHALLAADLGVKELRFASTSAMPGGGGACGAVAEAAMAIEMGLAETVVVYRSLCQGQFARIGRSMAPSGPQGPAGPLSRTPREADALQAFSAPFGVLGPSVGFALRMRRHMEIYGTTSDQLGQVAVTQRAYARQNPRAVMGDRPMTIADHQASRMVADPYRLLDCCLETDGACALVVTAAERGVDLRHAPIEILSSAQGTDGGNLGGAMLNAGSTAEDYASGGGHNVARRLYGHAGVTAGDIDVSQLYDNFSGQVLLGLEDFGFCARGESGPFVVAGNLALDGALPTNTCGGSLSEAYMQGLNHVIEGVRQLRGQSSSQVRDPELCLVTSSPGIPTSALVLGRP
jgi:acetyl-CoA acetyltransferase